MAIESATLSLADTLNYTPLSHPTHCQIFTQYEDLERCEQQWQSLWAANPHREIFQNSQWVKAWVHAFKDHRALFTPAVFEGDRLLGMIPLMRHDRELKFLGHNVSDYNGILSRPEHRIEVFQTGLLHLLKHRRDWDRIVLENLPQDLRLTDAIESLPVSVRRRVLLSPPSPCPTLLFGNSKEQLAAILRKDKLRKASKAFARLGEIRFRHLESLEEALTHLPLFIQQHVRRQQMAGRHSAFLSAEPTEFYRELLSRMDLRCELRFSVLELNGNPVAYHLGFQLDGRYLFYKPTFDIDYWEASPGQVLLYHLLQQLSQTETVEFDFGLGGESYKYRFSNHVRHNETLFIYPGDLQGLLRANRHRWIAGAKRKIRAHPKLCQKVENMQRLVAEHFVCMKEEGLYRYFKARISAISRKHLLFKERITILSAAQSTSAPNQKGENRVRRVKLGDLAEAASRNPSWNGQMLGKARERLKKGLSAYAVFRGQTLRQVVWVTNSGDVQIDDPNLLLDLPVDAPVIVDYWSFARPNTPLAPELINEIRQGTAQTQHVFAISQTAKRTRAFERSGFDRVQSSTRWSFRGKWLAQQAS